MDSTSPHFESPEHASVYLAWTAEFERQVRVNERHHIGALLAASISKDQHVRLQRALGKLDPDTARTCGTIVHLLTSILGEQEQKAA